MKPVWPTMRWSGRTLRSVTCQPRLQRLERLEVLEPVPRQGEHELLHLAGRGQVGTHDAAGVEHGMQGRQRSPRLRQIQDDPVVALARPGDVGETAGPKVSVSGTDPKKVSTFSPRRCQMLRSQLVGDHPPLGPTARQSAIVRAPDPVPASSTRAPGNTSA